MKKRAQFSALFLALALLGACENETTTAQRRSPQGALAPDGSTLPPSGSVPAPGGSAWDGLSDRADAVWGF